MYSQSGEGAQVAKKLELEGNDVAIYIKDKIYRSTFQGLLKHVDNPDSFVDKDTLIIFDISGNGNVADSYKRKGHLVYGSSAFADDLEHNRDFGFDCMKECKINIPWMQKFKDFKSGIDFVSSSDKRLVFKPNGSMPCKLTYVSKTNEELIAYLKFVESKFHNKIDDFILQEFIEGNVISSEFFCNSDGFLEPANHTVEVKKSMNDELGPSTGCSGNITWPTELDTIISQGVKRAESLCKKNNFVGQIDLNSVIDKNGLLYGLEWTPRFGYSATPSFLALVETDLGQFFSDICKNQIKELPISNQYSGSIRVSIPPYPAEPNEGIDTEGVSPNIGVPIQNWERYQESIYFYEVQLVEDQLCHSGGTGVICEPQGVGPLEDCLKEPYKIAEDLIIPDKQYRTDLEKVLTKMVKESEKYA
jgi:phosphoribosylamine--glycine ligase